MNINLTFINLIYECGPTLGHRKRKRKQKYGNKVDGSEEVKGPEVLKREDETLKAQAYNCCFRLRRNKTSNSIFVPKL